MTVHLKVIIKECKADHVVRIDEIKGTPEHCAAMIVSKYGGQSPLSMPAAEFLNMKIGER